MARYLLDTNILSNVIRDPRGGVAGRVKRAAADENCTSIIVAAELRFGAVKSGSQRLSTRVAELLDRLDVMPFDAPADFAYAELRVRLERAGTPIGANDLWIAAHVLALDLTLVTDNEREFSRVPDLRIENWLR
jgi:tRNA(fMet)-specific endonuclease VapC